jgi:hypothetical protein
VEHQDPIGSPQGSGKGSSEIVTITGVDLSTLPFSIDQIKLAVNDLATIIRMEDMPTDAQLAFNEQEMF